jgi:hypothetical protein
MALHSSLDQIQTTIPPLIADSSFEVCISRGLTFLGPLSISVPGTSQLDQGYPMPTMHQLINVDKVRSLCLHHDVNQDRPATPGLQSIQVTVQLNCTLAYKGGLQDFRTELCLQVNLPCSNVCLQWTRTWNSICFTMFPQGWQLTEACFPHLLRLVKVGNVSMLLFTANFKTPRGRFFPCDAFILSLQ